jgi:hypothetical protein
MMATMIEEKPCRHEYVRIYQRKLKGLDRRLVATRAYLPIGFKQADFGHLSEGSYCFCAKCRARLYPRRTQAEKTAARLATAQGKANQAQALADELALEQMQELAAASTDDSEQIEGDNDIVTQDIHVEELELESVDVQDIEAEGVKLADDQEVGASEEEDL